MKKTIRIDNQKVKVEANASTLLIYEDRFKGRRLLQDIDGIAKIDEIEKIPFSLCTKLLWATAKTADSSIPDIYEWVKDFSIKEIIVASQTAIELICQSIETSKKEKAAVRFRPIHLLMKSLHLQSKAD